MYSHALICVLNIYCEQISRYFFIVGQRNRQSLIYLIVNSMVQQVLYGVLTLAHSRALPDSRWLIRQQVTTGDCGTSHTSNFLKTGPLRLTAYTSPTPRFYRRRKFYHLFVTSRDLMRSTQMLMLFLLILVSGRRRVSAGVHRSGLAVDR